MWQTCSRIQRCRRLRRIIHIGFRNLLILIMRILIVHIWRRIMFSMVIDWKCYGMIGHIEGMRSCRFILLDEVWRRLSLVRRFIMDRFSWRWRMWRRSCYRLLRRMRSWIRRILKGLKGRRILESRRHIILILLSCHWTRVSTVVTSRTMMRNHWSTRSNRSSLQCCSENVLSRTFRMTTCYWRLRLLNSGRRIRWFQRVLYRLIFGQIRLFLSVFVIVLFYISNLLNLLKCIVHLS